MHRDVRMDRMFRWASFGCTYTTCPTTNVTTATPPSPGPSSSQPHLLSKGFDFTSDEELSELAKVLVPHNTAKCTQWALKNFEDWHKARNACHPDNPVPDNVLKSCDPNVINLQISRFIVETWKSNGECYPPSSLHQLLCGFL